MNKDAKGGQAGREVLLYQSRGVMRRCGGAFSVPRVGGVWSRTLILRRTCEVSESYGLERELHVH